LVVDTAVGAVGVPVNDGDAIVALSNMAAVFAVIAVVLLVILDVLADIALVLLVILNVFEAINDGNVVIVDESTPPTLFTVGKSAVPPKSFANFNLPLVVAVASGVASLVILAATKAVVAI